MSYHRLLGATALVATMALSPAVAHAQIASPSPSNPPAASESEENQDQTGQRPEQAGREQVSQDQSTAPDAGPNEGATVVVTGTRINRPTLSSIVPVTSITSDELLSTGNLVIGDALNDLPQLRSTFSQSNSTRFIGTTGLNELDLRGLGTSRTLVLVNGRRHVTSVPGTSIIDTNTIPSDLLERVDVVTGGNSAIYGSDAIAGVVNFVLRQNFEGLRLNGQSSISTHGDRGQQYVSGVAGKNFNEGRGNVAVAAEYSHADALFDNVRDFETGSFSGRHQFNLTENTGDDGPTGSDGIFDNAFYTGVRNGSISLGGTITAVCNAAALGANAARCRPNSNAGFTTAGRGQYYRFNADGTLTLDNTASIDFRDITAGGSANTVGGGGTTLLETGQLIPKQDRFSINGLAHYDFSDALQVYVEGKYVRITNNQEGQPSFFQNGAITLSRPNVPAVSLPLTTCNNAYLTPQNITALQAAGYCAAGATSTATIPVGRFNTDFGGRGELSTREIYRVVAGVKGTFNTDWKYDLSFNYGEFRSRLRSLNNLIIQRFANSANARRNAAGQIVCGINADAITTNDDPACVPVNLFGYQRPSQAALNYFNTTTTRKQFSNQLDVSGFVSGDVSQLFELPGGPIAFSVGGEYRREASDSVYEPLVSSGQTFLNAIQPFLPPVLNVKEAFGEVQVPLLKDMRFFRELTLNGAVRVSDYNNSAGTVTAYSGGAFYAPFDGLRFRGNYSRSVRVPTQSDLFSPFSQNFAQVTDPCDVLQINAGPNRTRNCAAAGVPVGFINTPARTQTQSLLSGGNPGLKAETSDSYTAGFILEPRSLIPGLSVTVDYYNITVKSLIATLAAQTILNQCYDDPTGIENQYCSLVFRNADSTFQAPAVISAGINFAKQKTSGIDIDYAYNHTFGNGDKLGLSVLATWVAERTNFINPANPDFADRQLSELGDPKFETQATVSYTRGLFNVRYQFQYIGPMTISTYEAQHRFDDRPPTNADVLPRVFYPAYTYHNLRFGANVNKKFNIYLGVDNILDKLPPYGLLGNGAGDAIYDPIGRVVYAGVKVNF